MNDIFQSLLTREELGDFIRSLEEIDKAFFTVHTNIDSALETQLDYIKRDSIISYFTKNNADIHNPQLFHQFVQRIVSEASHLPIMTITLSFAPTRSEVEEIVKWLYSNTSTKFILDVQVNPEIVGGCVLGYNGQYKDLSVKKIVEEYFSKGKPTQPTVLSDQLY